MSSTPVVNPTAFSWTDPTTVVGGGAIPAGGLTGYQVGVRPSTGTAGTYPILSPVAGAASASEALSAISPSLTAGTYFAAVQAVGAAGIAQSSAWSNEAEFTISPPVLSPPTNFTVA